MERLREDVLWRQDGRRALRHHGTGGTREHLRMVLINTYFAPKIHPLLIRLGKVNLEAYAYSQSLLSRRERGPGPVGGGGGADLVVQDRAFGRPSWSFMITAAPSAASASSTPEGHTIVEAAHIVPWSESRDDRPTNGLALCRFCHWSFDEGLVERGGKLRGAGFAEGQNGSEHAGHADAG